MKLGQLLKISVDTLKKAGIENPITDSQLLIAYTLKIPRWKVITEKNMEISDRVVSKVLNLINQRAKGIPVAYLTKRKEFFGINLYVDERVLIPRPETEILVEKVLEKLKDKNRKVVGLDIGIGSGAIAIALLKNISNLFMYGVDISEDTLKVAEINAKFRCVKDRLKLIKSNLFSNIDKDIKFDFIVSNPPYISRKDYLNLKNEVKNEPKVALISGRKGLAFYERIISNSPKYLKNNGFVAVEVGYNQMEDVKKIFLENKFKSVEIYKDLNGIDRVLIGYK